MAVTRIKNNQIFDKTITAQKIVDGTLVGSLFNPNLTLNSNVTIAGNLSVLGDSSTISSTNTFVNDPIVVFNNGYTGSPTADVGILVNRNLNPFNSAWVWNETDQAFIGIFTTDTGNTGTTTINNSGYVTVKAGTFVGVEGATFGNIDIAGNTISSVDTNGVITLQPNGTGVVVTTSDVVPSTTDTMSLGSSTKQFNNVHAKAVDVNGATIATNVGGDLIITPNGGQAIIANLSVSGGTFSGNIVSGNVTITGGTIDGTTIGATTAADGTFANIVDNGNFTANGTNAAISMAPTGTGTVTINPATAGSISNMAGSLTTLTTSGATTLAATSATSLTTANAVVTGGAITGTTISGSTGSFTTLGASGVSTLTSVNASGIVNVTDTTQSTVPTDGALIVAGGVGIAKNLNVGENVVVTGISTLGNIVVAANGITSTGDIDLSATGSVKIGALTMPQVDAAAGYVMTTDGAGVLSLTSVGTAVTGNAITLGNPTVGTLVDNNPAIATFVPATKVTDAVDKLNEILGKLVPPAPPAFPNGPLSISALSSGLRMTNFTQTDNTASGSKSLAAGVTVSAYRRAATYSTNALTNVGPGENGTVTVNKNGVASGSRVIAPTLTNNGTYGDLVISNNVDYGTVTSRALLFWNSFNASAAGSVSQGWNEVNIADDAAGTTNTPIWYYDASSPGTPVITGSTFAPTTEVTAFSSGIPHYTSTTVWTATGTATKLSGDLYPASDTFLTGTAGGQFQVPASVTYTAAGVTTPLARNFPGSAAFSTTVNTVNATGSSTTGPGYSVNNSYATGTGSSTPGGTVLTINTADSSKVNETKVTVGTFGSGGSANAVRIGGLATGATPANVGADAATWVTTGSVAAHEATVVAGVAKQDTTNYSTGYFPVGPNLSSGRSAIQYVTFRIQRDATSKFDISLTGKISGCKVALPGSGLDTAAAPTNGWIDMATSYAGSGVPGAGTGGNGNAGCALGGTMTMGSLATQSKTATFGTVSSNSSTGFYIYVRFALAAGDSITALSFPNATH